MSDSTPHDSNRTAVREPGMVPTMIAEMPASDLPEIPGYFAHREIARGNMGRVLAAHDLNLDREVAIKVILAGQIASDAKLRFIRES